MTHFGGLRDPLVATLSPLAAATAARTDADSSPPRPPRPLDTAPPITRTLSDPDRRARHSRIPDTQHSFSTDRKKTTGTRTANPDLPRNTPLRSTEVEELESTHAAAEDVVKHHGGRIIGRDCPLRTECKTPTRTLVVVLSEEYGKCRARQLHFRPWTLPCRAVGTTENSVTSRSPSRLPETRKTPAHPMTRGCFSNARRPAQTSALRRSRRRFTTNTTSATAMAAMTMYWKIPAYSSTTCQLAPRK